VGLLLGGRDQPGQVLEEHGAAEVLGQPAVAADAEAVQVVAGPDPVGALGSQDPQRVGALQLDHVAVDREAPGEFHQALGPLTDTGKGHAGPSKGDPGRGLVHAEVEVLHVQEASPDQREGLQETIPPAPGRDVDQRTPTQTGPGQRLPGVAHHDLEPAVLEQDIALAALTRARRLVVAGDAASPELPLFEPPRVAGLRVQQVQGAHSLETASEEEEDQSRPT